MESRVDPRAPVRRTRAAVAARDPTARVVDVRGDPVEGATVRVFVGDWRREAVPIGEQERAGTKETAAAYLQSPGITARSGSDGSVTFPLISEWGLRDSVDERDLPGENEVRASVPEPVDPEITNPFVLLVAEYDGPGATWFGTTRARYHQLTGVSGPSTDSNASPPELVLENRRLLGQRFGTPVGGQGQVIAWQAVADPSAPPEDIRSNHRLFVEVRAARRESFLFEGTPRTEFHTTDAVDQYAAQNHVGKQDTTAQHPLLLSGGVGVDMPEDRLTAAGGAVNPGSGTATVTPFVDDPTAFGSFSLALATATRLDRGDFPYPVFPLVRNAFHRYETVEEEFVPPLFRGRKAFAESFLKGVAGLKFDAYGNALTALQAVKNTGSLLGGVLPEGDPQQGRIIGDRNPSPNEWDGYRSTWGRRSNALTVLSHEIDEPPFAAVHRLPVDFLRDDPGTDEVPVVLSGGWEAGLDEKPPQKSIHTLSTRATVVDRHTPR